MNEEKLDYSLGNKSPQNPNLFVLYLPDEDTYYCIEDTEDPEAMLIMPAFQGRSCALSFIEAKDDLEGREVEPKLMPVPDIIQLCKEGEPAGVIWVMSFVAQDGSCMVLDTIYI